MSEQACECEKTKSLAEWIEQPEAPDHCPPCILKPLAESYLGTLEEAKATEQIAKLEEAWAGSDPLTIAKVMDNIKSEVGEPLRKDLEALDCQAQCFREAAAETQQQQE
jgi:hypothetical protein